MGPQEFKNLLDKFSRGECTPFEEQFIINWYENIGHEQQNEIKEEYRVVMEAKIWSRLQEQLGKPDHAWFSNWRKIAAVITFFLFAGAGAFVVYRNLDKQTRDLLTEQNSIVSESGWVSISNTESLPKLVKLHDGSEVTLEPLSEIRFHASFGNTRVVYLKGEAFFDVVRDVNHPFLVYSNEVVTRVLGTSFTVKAYAESKSITVAVKTGRVSVYTNTDRVQKGIDERNEVILAPNQRAVYDRTKNEVSRQLVERPEIVHELPVQLEMKYDGAQVVSVFSALEEAYGVDIEFDAEMLSNCTITTSLKEEGLFERIKVICEAIGAQYEVLGTSILIKSEGCH